MFITHRNINVKFALVDFFNYSMADSNGEIKSNINSWHILHLSCVTCGFIAQTHIIFYKLLIYFQMKY